MVAGGMNVPLPGYLLVANMTLFGNPNSAINIMNLTKCWIEKQERPACFQISSFTTSNNQNEVEKVRPS